MKRLVIVACLAALAFPAAASAHPLGNFTVNRYGEVVLSGRDVYVRYVVDLAEIPTFQEGDRLRRPDAGRSLARGLQLRIDGRRVALESLSAAVSTKAGAGGLPTLRLESVYRADGHGGRLEFRDTNFGARLGWREVVVRAERGAEIQSSTAPAISVSRALRAYPRDLLREPLDVHSATVRFRPGAPAGIPPAVGNARPEADTATGFEGLVSRDLTAGIVALSLALAFFWGAAHALGPGHGKAIVAAYLVGTRGTARHAVLLGLVVTVTHTIGVFALGLVTLALSQFLLPEQLYPWLNLASALLVVGVGVAVLRARYLHGRAHRLGDGHHHHDHGHSHSHSHEYDGGIRGLVATGISGGILPCPTALVVLLAAISLHRVGYGLLLIVAFSVGLAAAVTAVGLVAVTAKAYFARRSFEGQLVRLLPTVSALVVLVLGIAMTLRALPEVS